VIPFREVWSCDTEFQAGAGENPFVLCLVAREMHTQREIRLWRDDLIRLAEAPFDVGPDALFIAFFASAELGCFLQLGWPLPVNVLDLYAEHRVSTNGLKLPDGNSLLGVLARHGLAHMDSAEKESKRNLILRQSCWGKVEIEEILHYCAADVVGTEALFDRMATELDWPRALWRGRYSAAVARMEHCGVPMDLDLYNQLVPLVLDLAVNL
jgi:DNA polymerase I